MQRKRRKKKRFGVFLFLLVVCIGIGIMFVPWAMQPENFREVKNKINGFLYKEDFPDSYNQQPHKLRHSLTVLTLPQIDCVKSILFP